MGRGASRPHANIGAESAHAMPTVSIDYMFPGTEKSEPDERAAPIIAAVVHGLKLKASKVAHRKGAVQRTAERLVLDIKAWGLKRFVFKSDQEPNIKALKMKVIELLGTEVEVVPEASAVDEHESNGTMERAVQAIGGSVRTLKVATEQSCNISIGAEGPALLWMIEYKSAVLSRFEVGADGNMPYGRLRGKPFRMKLPNFGESVYFKPLRQSGSKLNKLDPKFREGVYPGVREGTNDMIVGTPEGIGRTGDIRRKPPSQRCDGAALLAVRGTPDAPNPSAEPGEVPLIPGGVVVDIESPRGAVPNAPINPEDPVQLRKRLYITKHDTRMHGWTQDCLRCQADLQRKPSTMAHSENCRARIETALSKTGTGRKRLRAAEERLGLAEEADREQLRGEVAVDPHPAEGMAVEPAALQPAGSASQRFFRILETQG